MANKTIAFDMDGTIADLYNVPSWERGLHEGKTWPYAKARPMVPRKSLQALKDAGYRLVIVSWGAMGGSAEYLRRVRRVKIKWCEKHYPGIFQEYHVVKYNTPKRCAVKGDAILVDDSPAVRMEWGEADTINAADTAKMLDALKELTIAAFENSQGNENGI